MCLRPQVSAVELEAMFAALGRFPCEKVIPITGKPMALVQFSSVDLAIDALELGEQRGVEIRQLRVYFNFSRRSELADAVPNPSRLAPRNGGGGGGGGGGAFQKGDPVESSHAGSREFWRRQREDDEAEGRDYERARGDERRGDERRARSRSQRRSSRSPPPRSYPRDGSGGGGFSDDRREHDAERDYRARPA